MQTERLTRDPITDRSSSAAMQGRGLRGFLSMQGARVLFCCSVVSVLYGMARILGPLLALDGALPRKMPAFGALNGYDLALFVVLGLLVLWRRALADAPLLVVLSAVLSAACGLALDTLVNDSVRVGYTLGGVCLAAGLLKQGFLARFIRVPLRGALFAAAATLVATNFLWNGALAHVLRDLPCNDAALVAGWRWGWMAVLAAGLVLWSRAVSPAAARRSAADDGGRPCIERSGLAWLVVVLLLVGSGVHAVSLGYIFDIPSAWPDYLPYLFVLAALLQEFLRRPQHGIPCEVATAAATLPVLAVGWAGLCGHAVTASSTWLEFAWYPPALMAAVTAWLVVLYLRTRADGPLALAGIAFPVLLLLAGRTGSVAAVHAAGFHGPQFWALLGAWLAALGLCRERVWLATAGAMAIGFAAAAMDMVRWTLAVAHLQMPAAMFILLGLSLLGIVIALGRRVPVGLVVFAAVVLALGIWQARGPWWTWMHAAWTLEAVLLGFAVWLRTGSRAAGAILATPLLRLLWTGHQTTGGWAYVGLGFALLAAGAWHALRRHDRTGGVGTAGVG